MAIPAKQKPVCWYRSAPIDTENPNHLSRGFSQMYSATASASQRIGPQLKKEWIKKRIYKTRELARADIFDYI
jgi:hypothetical protein